MNNKTKSRGNITTANKPKPYLKSSKNVVWEPNLTTLVDFPSKWQDLVDKKTPVPTPLTVQYKDKVGVYQGAGYNVKDVYRPCQDCRMRTNEHPVFCPVCQRALTRLIDFYTK